MKLARYAVEKAEGGKEGGLGRAILKDPVQFLKTPKVGTLGILLEVKGKDAALLISGEAGRHVFKSGNSKYECMVEVTHGALESHQAPPDLERKGALKEEVLRRSYEMGQRIFRDEVMERTYTWTGQKMVASLAEAIAESLKRKSELILAEA